MDKTKCGHPVAFLRSGSGCERAYLLAGGESRRMGQDKLFLPFGNHTLLDQIYTILSKRFELVTISTRSTAKFTDSNFELVLDSPRAKGPMAGIIASLEDCPDQTCFICAVDLPDISTELIDMLLLTYNGEDYLGVEESAHGNNKGYQSTQPLCGIWSKTALPMLYQMADSNNYRLSDLLKNIRTGSVEFSGDKWRNLNYPSDLDQSGVSHG